MNTEIVKPFIKATIDCFDMMMDVTPEQRSVALQPPPVQQNDICALIGFSGDSQGICSLTFDTKVAVQLVSRFLGEEVTEVDEGVYDAVGEMINIIAGNAKAEMSSSKVMISLPSVMHGEKYSMSMPKDVPIIQVEFDLPEIGEMRIMIGLKEA